MRTPGVGSGNATMPLLQSTPVAVNVVFVNIDLKASRHTIAHSTATHHNSQVDVWS